MRINTDNNLLPGIQTERIDLSREVVWRGDERLGEIQYVGRRRPGRGRGTEYGWVPVDKPDLEPMPKLYAVQCVIAFHAVDPNRDERTADWIRGAVERGHITARLLDAGMTETTRLLEYLATQIEGKTP